MDRNHRDVATSFRLGVAVGALLLIALGGTMAVAGAQSMPSVRWDQEDSPLDLTTHRRVVEVLESYYNFEFEQALDGARAIRDASPDDALGHFLVAEIHWLRVVNNADRPELREEFEIASRRATELSERVLKRDERDAMALFFMGGVCGRRAILAGMEGKHFETVKPGWHSRSPASGARCSGPRSWRCSRSFPVWARR